MNRAIKFRVWDKFRGEYARQNLISAVVKVHLDDMHDADYDIEQYTGVKDKNGVEVFEGDILKHANGNFSSVCFSEGSFLFKHPDGDESLLFSAYLSTVSGNIHQHPELLEGATA